MTLIKLEGGDVGDEPTTGEVSRSLGLLRDEVRTSMRDFRTDLRDGLDEISRRLDNVVHRDTYEADQRTRDLEVKNLNDELVAMRSAAKDASDERAANRRWLIAAIIIPLGVAAVEVLLAVTRGVGAG